MTSNNRYDVVIVGGSYAGLAAAMSLGRSLRKILVIDSGEPCNRQTPHSHNFLTQDGQPPHVIAAVAREQVSKYPTVEFLNGKVKSGSKADDGFEIRTDDGSGSAARKLIFATGVKDIMPDIEGFADCWGISVVHCPYCHGYEIKGVTTGIIANGDAASHYAQLISHLTDKLTIFTNGESTLTAEQNEKISRRNIEIIESQIVRLEHTNGQLSGIVLDDGTTRSLKAIYSRPETAQHCSVPEQLGCEVGDDRLLKIDEFQQTSVEGIYACGDNTTSGRSVAAAVSSGSFAGMMANKKMTEEDF
jgi:thioredoxin reductase